MPALSFEPMSSENLDAVMVAERRIHAFPWTHGNFVDSLAAGHDAWCMLTDGDLAGYGVVMLAVDEAHLLNIGILPERRRTGLGSRLLGHLAAVAQDRGAWRMLLEVRRSNVVGKAFYDRHGFVAIGERRGYYAAAMTGAAGSHREDAIVMAGELSFLGKMKKADQGS